MNVFQLLRIICIKYGSFRAAFKVFFAAWFFLTPPVAHAQDYKILAFGDSLTAGLGLTAEKAYPQQLEDKLRAGGYAVDIVNAGVSGDTTSGGLRRLDWSLSDQNFDLVLLGLGANDALRAIPPALVRQNLSQMIEKIQAEHIDILLLGMYAPRNLGIEYVGAFDRIYPELAEKYGIALYPFLLDGVAMNPDFNQSDGMHPNAKGAARIADKLLPFVTPFLDNKTE